jgi:hypothetical protein
MNLTKYSIKRIRETAGHWHVDAEYLEPLINYLVHGFQPGSFWSAVLANDFKRAVQSSHSANTITALKAATGWIWDAFPGASRGSPAAVNTWLAMSETERRRHLELCCLIYTEKDEIEMLLKFD